MRRDFLIAIVLAVAALPAGTALMAAPEYLHLTGVALALTFWGGIGLTFVLIIAAIAIALRGESQSPAKGHIQRMTAILGMALFGIGFVACAIWFFVQRPPEAGKPLAQAPKIDAPRYKSLAQLFENDFPNAMKVIFDSPYDFDATADGESEKAIPVRTAIYADYTARTEFAGYYIPRSKHVFQLILQLPNYLHDKIEEAHKRAPVMFKDPKNTSPPEANLTFSGRVFVYHEDELTPGQTGALWEAYNKLGLSVQFRGPDYPFKVFSQQPGAAN